MAVRLNPPRKDPETGCWVWQGSLSSGYGKCRDPEAGTVGWAHRVYYKRHKGPIPPGKQVHHLCGNRACVNPDHLTVMSARVHGRLAANAKLTLKQVREIRRRRQAGETGRALAAEFGVTEGTICHIRSGRTWQDDVECPSCGHKFDPFED